MGLSEGEKSDTRIYMPNAGISIEATVSEVLRALKINSLEELKLQIDLSIVRQNANGRFNFKIRSGKLSRSLCRSYRRRRIGIDFVTWNATASFAMADQAHRSIRAHNG